MKIGFASWLITSIEVKISEHHPPTETHPFEYFKCEFGNIKLNVYFSSNTQALEIENASPRIPIYKCVSLHNALNPILDVPSAQRGHFNDIRKAYVDMITYGCEGTVEEILKAKLSNLEAKAPTKVTAV